jgi:hypothetical protein
MLPIGISQYILAPGTSLQLQQNELTIINKKNNFIGKGNRQAYEVLSLFNIPRGEVEVFNILKQKYLVSQINNIEDSIKNIISWARQRKILVARA